MQAVVPQQSWPAPQAVWPVPYFQLTSSRIDGRYSGMLNGLALLNRFEVAPKVRKNRFMCSKTAFQRPIRVLSAARQTHLSMPWTMPRKPKDLFALGVGGLPFAESIMFTRFPGYFASEAGALAL
jgi:hypothetical protein